jgi:hypothetical protein
MTDPVTTRITWHNVSIAFPSSFSIIPPNPLNLSLKMELNLDATDDDIAREIKASAAWLATMGDVSLVTDQKETELLLAEFAEAGINVFDVYTTFQNIFRLGDTYIVQVKRNKFYHGYRGGIFASSEYEFSTVALKRLQGDFGTTVINPAELHTAVVAKWLSHIFSSGDVLIPGHDLFNSKYAVSATDKALAGTMLTDALLDVIAQYDDIHLSVVRDKVIICRPGVDAAATKIVWNIIKELKN